MTPAPMVDPVRPADGATPRATTTGVKLAVRGLHKSYNGVEVLKGIDFEVEAGEIFVIMGPSGCGKSVLLRQIIGLETPTSGSVWMDGVQIPPREITVRYRVAMVFQSSALFTSMTVGQNVGFYLSENNLKRPAEIAAIVARELDLVGLKGTENKMPADLSGGMRRRVAIARAMVIEPQVILYDEPTSELDPLSAVNIAEEIVALNARIHATSLVVSHDRDVAFGIAHRIAMMDAGLIIAIGTPEEIKASTDPRVRRFVDAHVTRSPETVAAPVLALPAATASRRV